MASASSNPELRVIHWGMARSLSTVFEKCMSFVDGSQIINEPYNSAMVIGPEGMMSVSQQQKGNEITQAIDKKLLDKIDEKQDGDATGWDDSLCTYQWVKDTLEGNFHGKKLVFAKDLVTGIHGKYEYLPKGYDHTFMIRNPLKVSISQRKLISKMLPPGTPLDQFDLSMFPFWKNFPGFGFGELLQLIEHLQKIGEIKGDPIIIDADDLQNHPESILKQYCEKTGIPFSKSLLSWEAGDGCVKRNWMASQSVLSGNQFMDYFAAAFASTGFEPAKDPPPASSLTPDVFKVAEICEPFYKKMYEMRIKP